MDRLFLDANVLFSAAYRPDAGLLRLWKLKVVELITSAYAMEEARLNLAEKDQRARLESLQRSLRVVAGAADRALPRGVDLPLKEHPILLAAIEARATHLLTGDKEHFGRYFGRMVEGVRIMTPGDYLRGRGE
ncbi:MAG: DNA-binding protein [Acidobacteria bacterium]|nr:DNA-binding protein [Acidobacteriota bacterium]